MNAALIEAQARELARVELFSAIEQALAPRRCTRGSFEVPRRRGACLLVTGSAADRRRPRAVVAWLPHRERRVVHITFDPEGARLKFSLLRSEVEPATAWLVAHAVRVATFERLETLDLASCPLALAAEPSRATSTFAWTAAALASLPARSSHPSPVALSRPVTVNQGTKP